MASFNQPHGTSVYVRAPPIGSDAQQSAFCDKLRNYFQKKRVSTDSDVQDVCVLSSDDEALWLKVTFNDPSGVKAALATEYHELIIEHETIPLHVQSFFPSPGFTAPPVQSDSDIEILNRVPPAVWDYQTPMNEILSSSQQKTHSQGVSQTSNLGASYNTNAGPDSQLSFTPSHQTPSTVASIWSMTPVAADVEQGLWRDFVPSNPWRYPATQPPPGFRYPTAGLGRGFSPRGSTGPQNNKMASIQPSQIRGFPLGLPTQFDKAEAPGLLDGNPARDKTAPSARHMCLREQVQGTAVRTTPGLETPVRAEEKKQDDQGEEEEGVHLVEVTGFKSTTSEEMLQMYFENRKSKGGEIEKWEMDTKTRTIRIKYSDPSVARAVTEKSHKLECANLKVRLILDSEEEEKQDDQGEEEEGVQLVEVTGFKSTTSEEMLQMYFENRKSKGGEIEKWEMDPKTGTIRIKYSDPSVAIAVAEKTHKLEGVNLKVRLILKRKTRPRPVKKRCLFLKGIPDGCPSEHVELYIEKCSGMDEPRVEYGENPGTALCTFARDIPDLQKVIQKICSKKLQKAQVTAEVMQESDSILVQGLATKMTLEFIELYFENKKKSGGGYVREVLPGNAEDQAIVYFEDWRVVADVLSKKGPHKVGSAEVSVEEYHDCLGRLSKLDVPTPHTPQPISMQVPQDIMEFIFGAKGKHTKKKLVVELKKVRALLRWPDGDKKTAARLEPLEEDVQPKASWLNWSQFCNDVLTGFLNRCKSTAVNVPSPLWKEARAKLAKISATQICSVLDDQTHSVQLVGEQKDVDAEAADILVVIKELQAKAASGAQQTKEEIPMPPNKLKLFTQFGIRRKMEKMFPDLKITIALFQGQMGLIVEGTKKKVVEAELWMRRQMDGLNSVEFKTGMGKTAFIRDVSDKIHEILGSKDINAACNISADGKIKIYGSSKKDTSLAKMYIDQEIEEDVIRINGPAVIAVLKSQDGSQLVAGINKKKFVKADINYQSGNIELAGFRNELKETKNHILAFLKDTVKVKGTIRTNRSKVRLITSFHGQELTGFTAKLQRDHVIIQPQMSGRNVGFLVEGNEEGLDAASQFVSQLLARIKEKPYPVSKIGMVQLFRETKGKKILESVEKELECVIDVIGENENDDEDVEGAEGATANPAWTGTTEVLCRLTLRAGCTLRVCKGDLTKQKVDCIVNAANTELKLVAGLSRAIVQAGGQIIQNECDQILKKKGRKLFEGEPVFTSSGSLPCKTVIHVAGPRWSSGKRTTPMLDDQPTHEERLLFDGVVRCLQLANQLRSQSISIPAISTGINGFPTKLAAIRIVKAVVEFSQKVPDTTLKEISLTNHDQPTCDVMKQVTMDQLGHLLKEEPSLDVTAGLDRHSYSQMHKDTAGTWQAKIGPVCLQICQGDLVTETSSAIVNSVGEKLDLQGPVSGALLAKGGNNIREECDALRTKDATKSVYVTNAGKLHCNFIFHVVTPKTPEEIKIIVTKTLQEAEGKQIKSISFPALGTGKHRGQAVGPSASAMLAAIGEFVCREKPRHLMLVRLVIFKPEMLPDFEAALRQEEGRSYKKQASLISRGIGWAKSFLPGADAEDTSDDESKRETILLHICAMDDVIIQRATDKIDRYQDEEYSSEDMPDSLGMIAKMNEKHHAELRKIERKYNVLIEVSKGNATFFRVQGRVINVKDARFSIQELFTRIQVQETEKQRTAKFETPSSWIPMKQGKHFQLVKLATGTQEYTDVQTRFRSSMGTQAPVNQIDEILRIQNTDLMMQYQARKAALEARLGRTDIEKTLYHGTNEQTCDKINKFGFNRSFCGKNATAYGNGTYFAAEASYSARSNYAKPNASKTKHIYATKVLVGDFTTGAQGMVVPPNKPNNPDQLYDSVVDNVGTPGIYVIFHDAQAYPEHLIKYK